MRTQNVRRDPNIIVGNNLYQSKKIWISAIIVGIASETFLLGTSGTTVKAETTNTETPADQTEVTSNSDTAITTKEQAIKANQLFGDCYWYINDNGELHIGSSTDKPGMLGPSDDADGNDIAPWTESRAVKEVVLDSPVVANARSGLLFYHLYNLTNIVNIKNLDTSNVVDAEYMFGDDIKLGSLDVENFNTAKVKDFESMFFNDLDLNSPLNVGNFDTSNATDMGNMFEACGKVTSLDVSKWNTSKVSDFDQMFAGVGIKSIDISNFDMTTKDPIYDFNADSLAMFANDPIKDIDLGPKNDFSNSGHVYAGNFTFSHTDFENNPTLMTDSGTTKVSFADEKDPNYLGNIYNGDGKGPKMVLVSGANIVKDYDVKLNYKITDPNKTGQIDLGKYNMYGGEAKTIDTPSNAQYPKYLADSKTITLNVKTAEDGTKSIVTDPETITYTKPADPVKPVKPINPSKPVKPVTPSKPARPTNSSSSSSESPAPDVEEYDQTVATFSDKPDVSLYDLSEDKMAVDKDRALAPKSDWKADKVVTINKVKYYRVATNEWVKSNQVYSYSPTDEIVRTNAGNYKTLLNAEGNPIKSRALAANTSWKTDRIAYINDQRYYRVATNEFVSASDSYLD